MNQLQSSYFLKIICRLKHSTPLTIIWQDSLLAKCEVKIGSNAVVSCSPDTFLGQQFLKKGVQVEPNYHR